MNKYFLKTHRLGFRKWKKGDLKIALKLWGDDQVTKLIDVRSRLTEKQVKQKLEKQIIMEKEYGVQYFPIFLLETEENVGCCGLRPYDLKRRIYEIGFHINQTFWRRGFAYEAANEMIEYAFKKMNASQLFAGHHPDNEGSKKLLNKLGFQYTHDEHYEATGLMHPSYILKRIK